MMALVRFTSLVSTIGMAGAVADLIASLFAPAKLDTDPTRIPHRSSVFGRMVIFMKGAIHVF